MPNVKAAIFCDDVRMEANGKLLLIGTYTGKMIVPSFPAQNQIRCVLILDKIDTSHLELTARVSGHAGAEFGELELEIDIEEDTLDDLPAWIPLPPWLSACRNLTRLSFPSASTEGRKCSSERSLSFSASCA
ncbi:DUF6941 family protein [Brevundimonas diminuta]|uniref:DUF6941 family protein n=1 Tax=Brevundimonas diminuta TaxID=293 RepID=UPI003D9AA6C6